MIVVATMAAGGATGVLLYGKYGPSHDSGAALSRSTPGAAGNPAAGTTPAQTPLSGSSSPAAIASSSPAVTPSSPAAVVPSTPAATAGSGTVAVAGAAAQNPGAPSVVSFLEKYFAAINSRDYQGYMALRSPQAQQGYTLQAFDSGYRSTVDSAETLVRLSTAANGDTVAAVTFTSHQAPDSADHEQACTSWAISLFLQQNGSEYLIDLPPSDYHASSAPC